MPRPVSRTASDPTRASALKVTHCIFNDALELHRQGEAEQALARFEQALVMYERYLKAGDPMIIKALNNVAATHDKLGNAQAAAEHYERARAQLERAASKWTINPFARRQNELMLRHLALRRANLMDSGPRVGGGVSRAGLLELGRALAQDGERRAARGDVQGALITLESARHALESAGEAAEVGRLQLRARIADLRSRAEAEDPAASLGQTAQRSPAPDGAARPARLPGDEGDDEDEGWRRARAAGDNLAVHAPAPDDTGRAVDAVVGGYDARRCPRTGRYKAVCECSACTELGADAAGSDAQLAAFIQRQQQARLAELAALRGEGEEVRSEDGDEERDGAPFEGHAPTSEAPRALDDAHAPANAAGRQPQREEEEAAEEDEITKWREGAAGSSGDESAPDEADPERNALVEAAIDRVNSTRDDMNGLQVRPRNPPQRHPAPAPRSAHAAPLPGCHAHAGGGAKARVGARQGPRRRRARHAADGRALRVGARPPRPLRCAQGGRAGGRPRRGDAGGARASSARGAPARGGR